MCSSSRMGRFVRTIPVWDEAKTGGELAFAPRRAEPFAVEVLAPGKDELLTATPFDTNSDADMGEGRV